MEKTDEETMNVRDIFDTIQKYHMIEEGMHVVAGVSGGADSVCLLYVLCEYRRQLSFELTAVHVEHGLRGEESLEDAGFTRKLCAGFGVPCRVVHAQVERLAQAEGISTEEAGRRERYRIFREVMEECGAQRIAVAHNRNDQAETVLWNLARGSALRGLGGMSPVRGEIIRPLLFTGREQIERILTEAGLPWRTDRTNLQQDYTRNRIRLSILPQMESELNARVTEHVTAASDRLRQVQEYLDRVTADAARTCIRQEEGSVCVDLKQLSRQDVLIREELLKTAVSLCGGLRDFGSVHLRALLRLCTLDCGRELSLPGRLRAVREDGILRLVRRSGAAVPGGDGADGTDGTETEAPEAQEIPVFESMPPRIGSEAEAPEAQEIPAFESMPSRIGSEAEAPEAQEISAFESMPSRIRMEADGQTELGAAVPQMAASRAVAASEPEAHSGSVCAGDRRFRYELLANSPELMCQIVEKKYTKWLSCDTITNHTLLLRTRRPGDYLVVNAAGGRKKLKDYLIDCKIPRDRRDRILLLADGSHVLWVIGYRISEAAKVTENTRRVLKVQAEERVYEGEDTDPADGAGG